jgi:hypothetical protein
MIERAGSIYFPASGFARLAADQVRAGYQSQTRQGARILLRADEVIE